jgi:hypothetical protein
MIDSLGTSRRFAAGAIFMENRITKCQWGRCELPATAHVRFGNRSFGTNDIMPSPSQNFTVLHRNLCDAHLAEVKEQYLECTEFEIGACGSCGPRR